MINKTTFDITQEIKYAILEAIKSLGLEVGPDQIKLEHPGNEDYGDYSSNIALKVNEQASNIAIKQYSNKAIGQADNPMELAKAIAGKIFLNGSIALWLDRCNAVAPGFINLWLKNDYLVSEMERVLTQKEKYGQNRSLTGKKIMVEFAHPNTHKAFHIGHLRNISTGEAVVRILEHNGAQVVRTNYQGDVGIHIAKCLWGIKQDKTFLLKASADWSLEQKAKYMGKAYVVGSDSYDKSDQADQEIKDINYLIYAAAQKYQQKEHGIQPGSTDYMKFVKGSAFSLDEIYELWVETRQWSLDYFDSIYQRVGSHFDRCYFESQCLRGIDKCYEALERGILTKSQGAIVFDGNPYGLDTRVFVNSLGLPTYEGKELGLVPMELSDFGHIDRIIHVVTPEQTSFFQVTFKVEELLGIQKDQQYHLAYNWVKLKQGKMSSRVGNVILGEWVLDEAKKRIKKAFPKTDDETIEAIAVGAAKHAFLKTGTDNEIAFDFDESISLDGNSGPYVQYTHARTQSVLAKSQSSKVKGQNDNAKLKTSLITNPNPNLNDEERAILRYLYRFPEVVRQAGEDYAPNLICIYLYELAQRFNVFYNKHRILQLKSQKSKVKTTTQKSKLETGAFSLHPLAGGSAFRLLLTAAVGQILQTGLTLLGIPAPEKM
ncbi:hypothetical protein A2160_04655 [Candidatus Beckwithbacteria bacterium RBG_13_42_9]|uniref:arginine--tRNA ligase n=1 Tax=Candidatus Beckwithbacteria bacterium RBG_13_42_9 TaxID=1797457 RepID=A0A1F5E488_9BACT|nr:MAG: hypothetical protein A2160_04655 [Candidatus Beckwithbacteria bacterium RBG_13_42_9]